MRNKSATFLAFAALFIIYVAFPTKNYYYDGIFFARVIEISTSFNAQLIHPNHLFYNLFGFVLYRLSHAVGLSLRAVEVLQIANSFAGVLSAYVVFKIMRERFSHYIAWTLTFLLAFSVTWWKFSTDADAYIISTSFLLICFYLVIPPRKPRPLLLVLVFSCAVFFHQLAILFYPIIILGLYWQGSERRTLFVSEFAISAFFLIFGVYCLAFFYAARVVDCRRFARWITSYSPDVSFSFNPLSNLRYTLRGHVRLLFGGRLSYLEGLIDFWTVLLIVIGVGLVIALLWQLVRRRTSSRPLIAQTVRTLRARFAVDPFAKLCALWILIYLVFLFFWLPHNTFYRLLYLPAIILLLGWTISQMPQRERRYCLALFVAIMSLANFVFAIFPMAHVEKNPPLALAREMQRVWPKGTVVYYARENTDNNLFQYFNPDVVWKPFCCVSELESELADRYVWLDISAIDQIAKEPSGSEWLFRHERDRSRYQLIDRAYRIMFIQVDKYSVR